MAVSSPAGIPIQTAWAIEVSGLTQRYGSSRALDRLDLAIPWEQRLAILGPNGAGKSTLLRIIATLIRPTRGRVAVGSLILPDQAATVRRHLGLVAHQTFLYDDLTAAENLIFYGRLYRVADPAGRAATLLARVGLSERANERVRNLSRGLQQRVALARAIVHDPPILLLDEPDTGLDVEGADLLGTLLRDELGRLRTTLFTTHNLDRAQALADRVIVLRDGRLILDGAAEAVSPPLLAGAIRGEIRR